MASELDICNLAVSHVAGRANVASISPPDGSAEAQHCAMFYPIARDAMLESFPWACATQRLGLATVAAGAGWSYGYSLPNNVLRPIKVRYPGGIDDWDFQDYIIETDTLGNKVLYTNAASATLAFITRVADTTRYSSHMVIALSHLLASFIAGPIVRGKTGLQISGAQLQLYGVWLPKAQMLDVAGARTNHRYRDFTPSSIAARS